MDVIALHQAGFTNAVASLGNSADAVHASLIKRYVREVYLTYDSDEAGTRAALRGIPILKEAGISAKVIRMDPYKDPDEFIKNLAQKSLNGGSRMRETDFCSSLEILEWDYDMNSPEGKTAFFREAARRLIGFEDELERNNYIEAVAKIYQISAESLKKLVTKTAIQDGLAKPVERPKSTSEQKTAKKEDAGKTAQKVLLTWMIEEPKLFQVIGKDIHPDDFTEELFRTVAELMYRQYEQGELNPAKILESFYRRGRTSGGGVSVPHEDP